MWEPRPLTPLWASTACHRDSFTFYFYPSRVDYVIGSLTILLNAVASYEIATGKWMPTSMCIRSSVGQSVSRSVSEWVSLSVYLPTYLSCSHLEQRAYVKRFVSLQFLNLRQSEGLLERGISSLRGRYLHRTTQTQNKRRQTSMPRVELELTIPAFEWAKTFHILNRAAVVIDINNYLGKNITLYWIQLALFPKILEKLCFSIKKNNITYELHHNLSNCSSRYSGLNGRKIHIFKYKKRNPVFPMKVSEITCCDNKFCTADCVTVAAWISDRMTWDQLNRQQA
jgi:hypothetical protein